ncbi:MAG: DivIVA domain-containing protein [Bacilli bacterium]
MLRGKVNLTEKNILEKEFQIDARGFRMQEVDNFLDVVREDYIIFNNMFEEMTKDMKMVTNENITLKNKIRELEAKLYIASGSDRQITNLDILRRIANLEKQVFGKAQ